MKKYKSMKIITGIIILVLLSGCASTKPLSMKPMEADIPELKFEYLKKDKWIEVYGHAGDLFVEGEKKILRIKTHKKGGNCLLNYVDGDTHFTKDCKGMSEVFLDLGKYKKPHPEVMGISVSMEKTGTQLGYFYPLLRPLRDVLPVNFKCPYSKTTDSVTSCTRPASYSFVFEVVIGGEGKGKLQYEFKCNNHSKITELYDVDGPGVLTLTAISDSQNFCVVGLALRQGALRQAHRIYLRFYNPKYIPLPKPNVSLKDGEYKICAPEDYELLSVNKKDYGSGVFSGSCKSVRAASVEALAWDTIGRFSRYVSSMGNRKASLHLKQLNGSTANQDNKLDHWDLYQDLFEWVSKKVQRICNDGDIDCYKKEVDALMYHPQVVATIEAWDKKYLYQ